MNLLKAATTVSLLTLASRITGLMREWIVATQFGASGWTDAFNVAFRVPNLLRRLFAEGAFSQAFVPLLGEVKAQQGDGPTRDLINAVASVLSAALVLTCLVGVIGAPVIVWLMASGLEHFDDGVLMTRLMFPYIGFMALVALAAGILNTYRHFVAPAATPILLNLSVIGAALGAADLMPQWGLHPVYALCLGVMVGGMLQLLAQWPALSGVGMVPRLSCGLGGLRAAWRHAGVKRILSQMAPAILGVSVAQVSLLINTLIASWQGPGAISWLTYADRLMEFPTALLGVALGVVLLPQLTAAQAGGDQAKASELLDWGLRLVALLAVPCAVALLVFALPLVAGLFHYGAFTAADAEQTRRALMGYGVGLVGLIGIKVLAPGFYAQQDVRTPVRIAIGVLLLTQILNALAVPWLGVAGLSLSIGVAALVNAGGLMWGLHRRGAWTPTAGWWAFLIKVFGAAALMGGGLAWAAESIAWIDLQAQWGLRLALLLSILATAGAGYLLTLHFLGIRLTHFARRA